MREICCEIRSKWKICCEIYTHDLHFSRISTAYQEIEPSISIEENTNFKVRLNSQNYEVSEICCEICTHDLHFCRISTANQEIEPAISIEENTNFNIRLNQQKYEVSEICCEIWTHDLHFCRISAANQRNRTGVIKWINGIFPYSLFLCSIRFWKTHSISHV